MINLTHQTPEPGGSTELHFASLPPNGRVEVAALSPLRCWKFGTADDGVIELAAQTADGGLIEIGLYYGSLKPKSIIKISAQVGCPARCEFCEVGDEAFKRNLSAEELHTQFTLMREIALQAGAIGLGDHLKVSVAGTGESLLNTQLVEGIRLIAASEVSFKVSTVFPSTTRSRQVFSDLAAFAGDYQSSVQIQISAISTDEAHRRAVTGIRVGTFEEIAAAGKLWRASKPVRPCINLSFIISAETPLDPLAIDMLEREHYRLRFRPYVPTANGDAHGLAAITTEQLEERIAAFERAGFIVSRDGIPTLTEQQFGLASNVSRRRAAADMP